MNILSQFFSPSIKDPLYKLFLTGLIINNGNIGNRYVHVPCKSDNKFFTEISESTSIPVVDCMKYLEKANMEGFIKKIPTCYNCKFHTGKDHVHFLTKHNDLKCCEN